MEAALRQSGLDFGAPTFVLAECVLVYMDGADSQALVRWLGERLPCSACIVRLPALSAHALSCPRTGEQPRPLTIAAQPSNPSQRSS